MKKKLKKQLPDYAKYTSIALSMAIIITAGTVGGVFLDKWVQPGFPVFTLVLSLASVVLAIYHAVRDLIKFGKKK